MSSYEEEKQAIWDWWVSEDGRIDREVKKGPGLDGENNLQHRIISSEFKRRLKELNAKYGKE